MLTNTCQVIQGWKKFIYTSNRFQSHADVQMFLRVIEEISSKDSVHSQKDGWLLKALQSCECTPHNYLYNSVHKIIIFGHIYNREKIFSRCVRVLRLLANYTFLASCTISNFENFQHQNSECAVKSVSNSSIPSKQVFSIEIKGWKNKNFYKKTSNQEKIGHL